MANIHVHVRNEDEDAEDGNSTPNINNNNSRGSSSSPSSPINGSAEIPLKSMKKKERPPMLSLRNRFMSTADLHGINDARLGMLQILKHEEHKRSKLGELALHVIFTAIFITIVLLQRDVFGAYIMNTSLETALITNQIDPSLQPFQTTYMDVGLWEEARDYLTSVLGGTLDQKVDYAGTPINSANSSMYLMANNRLLGGVRFRQLRVKSTTCLLDKTGKSPKNYPCFPPYYSGSVAETRPFGPPSNKTKYTYTPSTHGSEIWEYDGNYAWYGTGGYVVDMPTNSNFTERIQELIDDHWWDSSTRVIVISMSFLNLDLQSRCSVLYLVLEYTAGGFVNPEYIFKTFRIDLYTGSLDYFRAFLEIVFLLFLVYWIYQEVCEVIRAHYKHGSVLYYVFSLWNVMEVVNILAFVISSVMYIQFLASPITSSQILASPGYTTDPEVLASQAINFYNISAFNILIVCFRTFKYFRLNFRLYMIWRALKMASMDLLSFLIMFFIMLVGFILMGILTFGPDTDSYNTFAASWGSTWNFVLGNPPDYSQLSQSNRVLGPLYFMLFTIFVFFIMVNMFIAILNEAFSEVRQASGTAVPRATLEDNFKEFVKGVRNFVQRRKTVSRKELIKTMKDATVFERDEVTEEDMKQALGSQASDDQVNKLLRLHKKLQSGSKVSVSIRAQINKRASMMFPPMAGGPRTSTLPSSESNLTPDRIMAEIGLLNTKIDNLIAFMELQQKDKRV